jgi:predicted PhzF superfamily epimerase YddE/YHI9
VVGPWTTAAAKGADFEVRAFIPNRASEDPVTGSLNAGLAQWLIGEGIAPKSYIASQGTALGRAGRVHVELDGDDIWVGGNTVTVVDGTIELTRLA